MNQEETSRLLELRRTTRASSPGREEPSWPRQDSKDDPTFRDLLWVVIGGHWAVISVLAATVAIALGFLVVTAPVYRSSALLQVEDTARSIAGIDELSSIFGERSPADTEIEILHSRSLLGDVVDQLGLTIEARPGYFPVVGAAWARHQRGRGLATPWPGLTSFAWGGEQVRVQRLDVSQDLLDRRLTLTALGNGEFRLDGPDGGALAHGVVGKPVTGTRGETRVEGFVSELVARPGTTFTVSKLRRDDVIDRLQKELRVEEKGKKTGILILELEGHDPARVAATLDSLSKTYVRRNVERKSSEAARTLEFIESQLPLLKRNLDTAEASLTNFQLKRGTVDLSAETQSTLDRSVDLEKALSDLGLQRAELLQRFTAGHPSVAALDQKAARLRAERDAIAGRMKKLPTAEVDSARLTRDVKVATELYSVLLNKAQELRIAKSGTIGNARIVDAAAVPYQPVFPRPVPVLVIAVVLGLLGGIGLAFARNALADAAVDAEEVERGAGLPVFATIPHSGRQGDLERGRRRGAPSPILAVADPGDIAIENLRSLRTSLQFALVDARNVIAVSGPAPDLGKSFVTVNLAHVLAAAGTRVLIVDGDLRRGRVHRYFGARRSPGLSELVSGTLTVDQAVRPTHTGNLDLLATGRLPPNPAELLATDRFRQVFDELSKRYDLVVVDTPPILAVTDAALIAAQAGVNLLVLRAGRHPIREITLTMKRLAQNGIRIHGAVLNDVVATDRRYGRYGRFYQYEYRSSPT